MSRTMKLNCSACGKEMRRKSAPPKGHKPRCFACFMKDRGKRTVVRRLSDGSTVIDMEDIR